MTPLYLIFVVQVLCHVCLSSNLGKMFATVHKGTALVGCFCWDWHLSLVNFKVNLAINIHDLLPWFHKNRPQRSQILKITLWKKTFESAFSSYLESLNIKIVSLLPTMVAPIGDTELKTFPVRFRNRSGICEL